MSRVLRLVRAVLGLVLVLTVILVGLRELLREFFRLRLRTYCWVEQGRVIGVRGTVRNQFRDTCEFELDCDCVRDLISTDEENPGALERAIRDCRQHRQEPYPLFGDTERCTTMFIEAKRWRLPGPNWIVQLRFEDCYGDVILSCAAAELFSSQLRAQWEQCCAK